jgi:predicted nuclease of predicted toxin-antitoxin system
MKLLIDMNLSPVWVDFLVAAGFEAVHWSHIGRSSAPDTELMIWAAQNGHVVLTCDLDFAAILAASQRDRPSVLQIRSDALAPQQIGPAVVAALRQAAQELNEGAIVSLDIRRARLRILSLTDRIGSSKPPE